MAKASIFLQYLDARFYVQHHQGLQNVRMRVLIQDKISQCIHRDIKSYLHISRSGFSFGIEWITRANCVCVHQAMQKWHTGSCMACEGIKSMSSKWEIVKGMVYMSRAICIYTQWVNQLLFVSETRLTSSFISLFQGVSSPAFVFDSHLLASLKEDPGHDDLMWQRCSSFTNIHYLMIYIYQKNQISSIKHVPNRPLTKRDKNLLIM